MRAASRDGLDIRLDFGKPCGGHCDNHAIITRSNRLAAAERSITCGPWRQSIDLAAHDAV
jgi:hypothetical protein